jgi:membrane protease YdiL (CAAX protease family)
MPRSSRLAVVGVVLAIAITTAMDATGYTMFSALPLLALTVLFWILLKLSRAEMGLKWGSPRAHAFGLAYPVFVLGVCALVAVAAGGVDVSEADWGKAGLNMVLMSSTGILMALLTEEGFFRGWLWGALDRSGRGPAYTLIGTTVAFTLWHVSPITLDTGFDVPARQVPVYLINATAIGAVWGMLRWWSGSAVVASVSHAVWNGLTYPLFGFGEGVGALGIARTDIFGPEVGILAIPLNLAFAAFLWTRVRRSGDGS